MNTLVLGSGGREHAIAWKLRSSPQCTSVYVHPGNPGIQHEGFNPLPCGIALHEIIRAARKAHIELIIIGPEHLLALDFATKLRDAGFLVVGPNQGAAQLETSKVFSKLFMKRAAVPTADFIVLDHFSELENHLKSLSQWPTVLKLDGLAAGKGVVIANSKEEALDFGERIWKKNEFGPGPQRLLLETCIPGVELSYLGLCDGKAFIPLSSATDFKRIFDQDLGPNTGGMGAMSPSPYLNQALENKITETIVRPILNQLQKENLDFRGILYIGLMITPEGNPYILEFNTRFGDPETQSLMLRIESDLIPFLLHTAQGTLRQAPILKWKKEYSVYVVVSAEGYPSTPRIGDPIEGLDSELADSVLFYSGVGLKDNVLTTQGGRVLGIGALGTTLEIAREKVYKSLEKIRWPGMHYRKDIAQFKTKV